MKKELLILILFLILLSGCTDKVKLSDLQITACNTAHEAGLQEVGIVLKEECCKALGKCCE